MKVKVCGLKESVNIQDVAAIGPDYMGFICYDKSPRFMGDLLPEALKTIAPDIVKTGVFVNHEIDSINGYIQKYDFGAVQLHGNETPEFCAKFKNKLKVLKAFGIDEDFDFNMLNSYTDKVDFFLFDTKTAGHGGSGKTFNWDSLKNYKLDVPFFLSGGIGLENIQQAMAVKHPQFYGVDLNSRFETQPGIKNIEALKQAFNIIKKFDTHEIRS